MSCNGGDVGEALTPKDSHGRVVGVCTVEEVKQCVLVTGAAPPSVQKERGGLECFCPV